MLENQDVSTFEKVIAPKKTATRLFDEFSSVLCPTLQHFVVFSSLSCSYGNAGQTNYGYANACCERICEKRRERGLPAVVVQWGAVDQVGMFTQMDMEKTCKNSRVAANSLRLSSLCNYNFYRLPTPAVSSKVVWSV